ncbi:DUF3325 domain-containing protein [Rhodovarius crocodyli]|uniref:DUF3325 domain-containing protein n=1 Tax=Rhodovarius crocodyli TaxID=1979269 RepID=A0A437MJG0_9PROT|nr:DUF3325 domain-containing protein [Rhodovarius crocodyli]RVT97804.1 DUF3325 domain-containing protein [Rhodovarius crocodyli]
MALLALGLAYPGFLLLALAMERHHRDLLGGVPLPPRRRLYTASGWLLLGLSLLPCAALWGWTFGVVAWLGVLAVAATTVAMLSTYHPRLALIAAPLVPVPGVVAWFGFH